MFMEEIGRSKSTKKMPWEDYGENLPEIEATLLEMIRSGQARIKAEKNEKGKTLSLKIFRNSDGALIYFIDKERIDESVHKNII